mgnify:CR=1 FL=1
MATEIASLFARIGADLTGLTNGLAGASTMLQSAGRQMQATGSIMTAGITLPLVGMGVAAAKAAMDLDAQMRNIQSISKGTDADIAALSETFVRMSTDINTTRDSAERLAAGFYQIQSSGFAGKEAMTILEVSTKAASAGLTSTEVAAKAILSVLNAYGMEASEAAHVSDVLFKSVDIGIFSFEEIAGAIGDTLGSAAAAKIPIEELAAAFATITKAGISADEAATSINQLMLSFISPSKEAQKAAQALGFDLSLSALQTKGLGGVIQDLANHTKVLTIIQNSASDQLKTQIADVEASEAALKRWKLEMQAAGTWTKDAKAQFEQQSAALKLQRQDIEAAIDASADYNVVIQKMAESTGLTVEEMAALFPNVRALRGALALAREGGADFAADLETIAGAAGATTAAFAIQTKSWAAQWDNFKNKGTATAIAMGQIIVPALLQLMTAAEPFIAQLKNANPEWIKWAVGIAVVLAALGPLLMILGTLATVAGFLISPIGLLVAAIAALGVAYATNFGGIRDTLNTFWTGTAQPILTQLWTWLQTNIPTALATMSQWWTGTALPALQTFWGWVQSVAGAILARYMANLATLMQVWGQLHAVLMIVWAWMSAVLFPYMAALANFLSAVLGKSVEALAGLWQNILLPALKGAAAYIATSLLPQFQALWDFLSTTFGPILQWLGDFIINTLVPLGFQAWASAIAGISLQIQNATKWLNTMADTVRGLKLPAWLTPGSPTPFEMGLRGIASALANVSDIGLPKFGQELGGLGLGGGTLALAGAGAGAGPAGGNTVTWNGNINVDGSQDPEATTRQVIRGLEDRGLLPRTRLR